MKKLSRTHTIMLIAAVFVIALSWAMPALADGQTEAVLTATPTATATSTPVPTATPIAPGQLLVAERLAEKYDVSVEDILAWREEGYGFGEIAIAYGLLTKLKEEGVTVEDIFALRAEGKGWGQIAKAYETTLKGIGGAGNGKKGTPTAVSPNTFENGGKGNGKGNGNGNNGGGNGNDQGNGNGNGKGNNGGGNDQKDDKGGKGNGKP